MSVSLSLFVSLRHDSLLYTRRLLSASQIQNLYNTNKPRMDKIIGEILDFLARVVWSGQVLTEKPSFVVTPSDACCAGPWVSETDRIDQLRTRTPKVEATFPGKKCIIINCYDSEILIYI